jgi:hypothetical protein
LKQDYDAILMAATRGFPGAELVPRLQRRPSAALLRMMGRRLARPSTHNLAARRAAGEALRTRLPEDALLLGEATATHLGVSLAAVRRSVAVLVAVLVGVPVAACGPIAFVGLLAPHVARMLLGPRHGGVLPAAALAGAGLLVVADVVARTVVAPVELPIGVLTTLLGGPLFLTLLLRHRGVTA